MENTVIQKYINTDLHEGTITFSKEYIANYIDMIRTTPNTARVLTLLSSYASRNNKVITDAHSIGKLLGITDNQAKSCIRNLIENGWVTMQTCKLDYQNDIIGVRHDRNLYNDSIKTKWNVIEPKFITNFKLNGEFNIITINESMIMCEESTETGSNLILSVKNNLFFDKNISEEEIEYKIIGGGI